MPYWGQKRKATNHYVKMPIIKKNPTKPYVIANTSSFPEF